MQGFKSGFIQFLLLVLIPIAAHSAFRIEWMGPAQGFPFRSRESSPDFTVAVELPGRGYVAAANHMLVGLDLKGNLVWSHSGPSTGTGEVDTLIATATGVSEVFKQTGDSGASRYRILRFGFQGDSLGTAEMGDLYVSTRDGFLAVRERGTDTGLSSASPVLVHLDKDGNELGRTELGPRKGMKVQGFIPVEGGWWIGSQIRAVAGGDTALFQRVSETGSLEKAAVVPLGSAVVKDGTFLGNEFLLAAGLEGGMLLTYRMAGETFPKDTVAVLAVDSSGKLLWEAHGGASPGSRLFSLGSFDSGTRGAYGALLDTLFDYSGKGWVSNRFLASFIIGPDFPMTYPMVFGQGDGIETGCGNAPVFPDGRGRWVGWIQCRVSVSGPDYSGPLHSEKYVFHYLPGLFTTGSATGPIVSNMRFVDWVDTLETETDILVYSPLDRLEPHFSFFLPTSDGGALVGGTLYLRGAEPKFYATLKLGPEYAEGLVPKRPPTGLLRPNAAADRFDFLGRSVQGFKGAARSGARVGR